MMIGKGIKNGRGIMLTHKHHVAIAKIIVEHVKEDTSVKVR